MRANLTLFIALLVPAPASAQLLVGRVIDDRSRLPVADAAVELVDARGARVVTLRDGHDRRVPARGAAARSLRSACRAARFRTVHIATPPARAGETVEVQVRLGQTAIPLEPVVVTARSADRGRLACFRERVATHPSGKFVTRDEIDRRPTARVTDFFRTMAGATSCR